MSSNQKRRLDRRNAIKNIEYDPSSSACEWPPSPFRPQSLEDLDRGNFRVRGTDGEFDRICSFLGLSGPDDFAIPAAAWEARKSRPDHLPSPSSGTSHNLDKQGVSGLAEGALSDAFQARIRVGDQRSRSSNGLVNPSEVQARVREVQAIRYDYNEFRVRHDCINDDLYPPEAQGGVREIEEIRRDSNESGVRRDYVEDYLTDAFQAKIRVGDKCSPSKNNGSINQAEVLRKIDEVVQDDNESRVSVRCNGVGGCGIKGDRPPLLVRPVAIKQPVVDNVSSTWDLLRSFGPQDDEELCSTEVLRVSSTVMLKEEDRGVDKDGERIVGENGDKLDISRVLVRDDSVGLQSSIDTLNHVKDEGSSNAMTREPLNCISPNGGFKRRIKGWQKGDFLGSGSFGTVYEGFTDHGFFFAVKEVSLLDQGSQGKQSIYQLEQEISLLSQFEHENIVKYLGTDMDDSKLYIFLELVTKGSLANLYQKYQLRDSQVSAYTRQILNGLNYLHSRNVVHRDIKCANILVHASGSVKLADFGLAKATKLNDLKSSKGTAFWMAPEVVNLKNRGYGLAADIWSLGCTVLEMLTRKVPYSHLEGMQALFRIGKGERPLIPSSLSVDAQDFIFKCLQVIPDDRPTAAQLLDHPFVKRPLSSLSVPQSLYHNGTRA